MTRDLVRIGGLVVLAACGRLGFDSPGLVTDNAADDAAGDAAGDAVTDGAPACTTFGPFGPPVHVPELSSVDDDNAVSLSADQLYVVLERHLPGDFLLFQASRPSIDSPFSTPTPVVELDMPGSETNPSLSPDGLTIYFAREAGSGHIQVATRPDRASPFSAPVQVTIDVVDMDDVLAPEISDDGQELIFNRYIGAVQASNLMRAVWDPQSSQFVADPPDGLTELGIGSPTDDYAEAWASLSSDGRTIHFQVSDCAPGGSPCPGSGENWRIYTAERPAPGAPFGTPRPVTELVVGPGVNDGDPELSADGTTLWFSSNRPGGIGGWDVWKATRACL